MKDCKGEICEQCGAVCDHNLGRNPGWEQPDGKIICHKCNVKALPPSMTTTQYPCHNQAAYAMHNL